MRAPGRRASGMRSSKSAVWAAIAELPRCANPPPAGGRADLRLDFEGTEPPEVRWRDTFGDSVVRLDEDAVMRCVRPGLRAVRREEGAVGRRGAVVSVRGALSRAFAAASCRGKRADRGSARTARAR